MKKTLCTLLLCMVTYTGFSAQPRLIVQLVIDQLRGDLIYQHQSQFGKNGFNYLIDHGIDYHNANHPHANTTTCAGHATIATGSYPSLHGVVDNDWYDRKTKQLVYCMEDLQAKILPTVHTRKTIPGRSPHNLKQSTLSDQIVLAQKGKAFGVSFKDRAAITLAGHAGKAFWFDKTNGGFVTSNFYYSEYPAWVNAWNKQYHPQAFDWQLSAAESTYKNKNNQPFQHDYLSFGQRFPHHVVNPPSGDYFIGLSRTPNGDKLTGEFATKLLEMEQLGRSATQTDYLAVSFSSLDAIGHQFGPNSMESEDNLLQLDQTLARFFAAIDKQVGLENTLIVLTADHGVSDSPSYLRANHIAEIKPVNVHSTEQFIQKALQERFKLPSKALLSINPPYVYLDHQLIYNQGLSLPEVSNYLAQQLNTQPGVFRAFALPLTIIEKDWLSAKVDRMAYPDRAGDIYIVQPLYQSYGKANENRVAHGSPWQYDSYVPLLFAHPSFKSRRITRPVFTTDIASTLAALLVIQAPSGSVGEPLQEVLEVYKKNG